MNQRRTTLLAGLVLAALALCLRLIGLGWGLPEVYEEATPLHKAWAMWGGSTDGFDPNPHFFNYPSLVIYLHLVWQGLQMVLFKVAGLVSSGLDFRVMFEVEKTPVYYAGRLLTALLGTGTVVLVFRLGCRLAGLGAGIAGAFLLAVNTFHIDHSQLIAVDVPLAFFMTAALLAMAQLSSPPRLRQHLLTGAVIGLAISAKYTGAALVVPYLVTHLAANWRTTCADVPAGPRQIWVLMRPWLLGLLTAVLLFGLTSPFVILDHEASLRSLTVERDHMQQGHFGLGENSSGMHYFKSLATGVAGWPMLLAAGLGLWALGVRQRQGMLVALAVFLVVFLAPISFWAMKADRYLIPLVPVLAVMAGCGVAWLGRMASRRQWPRAGVVGVGALITLAICVPSFASYSALQVRARTNTRTTSLRWIENNIPAGAFILTEYFGPELLRPTMLLPLAPEIQEQLLSGASRRPVYAVQVLPLFQTRPERSAVYYNLHQYPDADYILVSGAVKTRYAKNSTRFSRQQAFYRELESTWERVRDFEPGAGTGPRLALFKNPRWDQPYSQRPGSPPVALPPSPTGLLRDEGFHYFSLGANAMRFGQDDHAEQAFRLGLKYQPLRPEIALNLVLGAVRVMENQRAAVFLDSLQVAGPPVLQDVARQLRVVD